MNDELKHWTKVAEKDIKELKKSDDYIFELSNFIAERIEYCSDRWCIERLIHVELLVAELKKAILLK